MYRRLQYVVVVAAVVAPLLGPGHGAARTNVKPAPHSLEPLDVSKPLPEPLKLPNSALKPIDWSALGGWATDDHAAAFATFVTSCRPLLRTILSKSETRPMYLALTHVCRQALAAGRPTAEQARMFFERNFRPLRIAKLGENAGFLTRYYEPIVDGSRVPTGSRARLKGVTVGRLETATRRGLSDRVLKPLHPSDSASDGSIALLTAAACAFHQSALAAKH